MLIIDAPRGTKVGQFYKLIVQRAEENVVWLDIAMDIPLGMEVTNR
jgi:hypothetical protein